MIAQVGLPIPEIPWAAISPELVLFAFALLALVLDTAGEDRVKVSSYFFVVVGAAAGFAAYSTGQYTIPGMIGLLAAAQLALTFIWRERPRLLGAIVVGAGFLAGLGVTGWQWAANAGGPVIATDSLLAGMVAVDGVALFTRFVICIAGLITVPLSYAYMEDRRIHRGEYYPLLLLSATGMTLLASAADLLMVFISIEILSLALYILCGFAKRDLRSQESAFKYFLLGSFSSAIMLYGIALAYGAAGTTNIAAIGDALASIGAPPGLGLAAMALLLVGFAFKTAIVPFHMWTPDVYQGAPTPVTGFMAAATKAAAFAAFLRVFAGGLGELQWSWQPIFWVLAVLTMLVGAILAVVQLDLKRMLGYSAIAHAGYLLIGIIAVSREGISATLFYLLAYTFMTVGAFGVLSLLERRTRTAMALADLRGLGRRYPVLAGMFALFLLSLAGIPGTAGFMAKLAVFRAGIQAGWTLLVVVAVVSSMIAAFFYIRVIVTMFMEDEPVELATIDVPATPGTSIGIAAAAAAVVVLGIVPGVLVELARQAASLAG
jgi:NADH-quinone oxidoreductase subunit N